MKQGEIFGKRCHTQAGQRCIEPPARSVECDLSLGAYTELATAKDELAGAVAALLMGPDGDFITGSDFLMDGGVTAAYWYGEVPEVRESKR